MKRVNPAERPGPLLGSTTPPSANLGTTRNGPGPALLWGLRLLALAGCGLCAYLAWQSLALGGRPAGCGPESACDAALSSRWSRWFGVPVSLPAAVLFLALLLTSLVVKPLAAARPPSGAEARRQRAAWAILAVLAATVAVAAVWFISLQVAAIGGFCPYCMAVHVCGLLCAALVAVGFSKLTRQSRDSAQRLIIGTRPTAAGPIVLGAVLAPAVLIVGQFIGSPRPGLAITHASTAPTGRVTIDSAEPSTTRREDSAETPESRGSPDLLHPSGRTGSPTATSPTATSSVGTATARAAPKLFDFTIGNVSLTLDPHVVPLLGDAEAPHLVLVLVDYTCAHCRRTHRLIDAARMRYGGQIAWAILPVPLNSDCNALVKQTLPAHADACGLARLALAVWAAKPEAFASMDAWLVNGPVPPSVSQARAHAVVTVSSDELRKAEAGEQVSRLIQRDVAIWGAAKSDQLPKLVLPHTVLTGEPSGEQDLFTALEKELGVHPVNE